MRQLVAVGILLFGCGSSERTPGTEGTADDGYSPPLEATLAAGLRISEIAGYQALKVPLVADGEAVEPRPLELVRGRPMLLRVFVDPESAWEPREVIAKLAITSDGTEQPVQEIKRKVDSKSFEDDIGSTFSFDVSAEQMTVDAKFSVSIWEIAPGVTGAGSIDRAAYPAEGTAKLGAVDVGPSVKIVLVPFQYNADGSGRLPDTSAAQVKAYRDTMWKLYPTPEVEISVHDPMPWENTISAFGGWGDVLNNLLFWREYDGVPRNVYYYGIFEPKASLPQYCTSACVLGLSTGSDNPNDDWSRGSVGIGYGGPYAQYATETFAHEIGHAQGRLHSPCGGAANTDPAYPYGDGGIGSWGYDLLVHELLDPGGDARDIMGYCEPNWISDFTYRALFERIGFVNNLAAARVLTVAPPGRYRMLTVEVDGGVAVGKTITLRNPPHGQPKKVELLGRGGASLGVVTGWYYPFDHLPGGTVLVAEPEPAVRSLRFLGRTLTL